MKWTSLVEKTALISSDELYRYRLGRRWDDGEGKMVYFLMLNPSTADAEVDDATIRRCMGFAMDWGYGRLVVGNLYGYRATDPRELARAVDPVGPSNDSHVLSDAVLADRIVCAWGAHPMASKRSEAMLGMLKEAGLMRNVGHLGMTKEGQPRHPLFLAKTTRWERFS